ncbi:MAG: hypothetical protein COU30_02825, partial [Candidatus Magasanikbacteria bacterium CG10_big_fil_rev_8_21_14_0_10_38_6]
MSIIKKTYEKIFGSHNEQILKEYRLRIEQINNFEAPFEKLTVQELQGKTQEFKNRLKEGESLDDILPEAF